MPSDLIYNTLKGENRLSDNVNSVSLHKVTAGVGEIYGSHIISQEILLKSGGHWIRSAGRRPKLAGIPLKNAQAIGRAINLHNIPATSLKVRISTSQNLRFRSAIFLLSWAGQACLDRPKTAKKRRPCGRLQILLKSGGHWIRTSGYLTISAV